MVSKYGLDGSEQQSKPDPKTGLAESIQAHHDSLSPDDCASLEQRVAEAEEKRGKLIDEVGGRIGKVFGLVYKGSNAKGDAVFIIKPVLEIIKREQTQAVKEYMQKEGLGATRHDALNPGTIHVDLESLKNNPELLGKLEARSEEIQGRTEFLVKMNLHKREQNEIWTGAPAASVPSDPSVLKGSEGGDRLLSAGDDKLAESTGRTFTVDEDGKRIEMDPKNPDQPLASNDPKKSDTPVASTTPREYPPRTNFDNVPKEEKALVTQAQQQLIALGGKLNPDGKFAKDGADGLNGPVTTAAVIEFKKDHGINPPNGTITPELVEKMQEAVAAKERPAEVNVGVAPAVPAPALAMSPESASQQVAPDFGLSPATLAALKAIRSDMAAHTGTAPQAIEAKAGELAALNFSKQEPQKGGGLDRA